MIMDKKQKRSSSLTISEINCIADQYKLPNNNQNSSLIGYKTDSTNMQNESYHKNVIGTTRRFNTVTTTTASRTLNERCYSISSSETLTCFTIKQDKQSITQFMNGLFKKPEIRNLTPNLFTNGIKSPASQLNVPQVNRKPNSLSTNSTCYSPPNNAIASTKPSGTAYPEFKLIEPKLVQPKKKASEIKKLNSAKYYIINFKNFRKIENQHLNERAGSEKDVEKLLETFQNFNMKGKFYEDLKLKELKNKMKKISKEDFSKNSAVVIAIMSHGGTPSKLYANDASFSLHSTIIEPLLKNQHLSGKPKIIFVEACKGDKDPRYQVDTNSSGSGVLIFEAAFEGFVSYTDRNEGSYFTQSLCQKITEMGKTKRIQDICFAVIDDVTAKFGKLQTPTITINLTDNYCFGDYC